LVAHGVNIAQRLPDSRGVTHVAADHAVEVTWPFMGGGKKAVEADDVIPGVVKDGDYM